MKPIEYINFWKKKFEVLNEWSVFFDEESKYKGQCIWYPKKKQATIYAYGADKTPDDYYLHEILHIAMSAVGPSKKREEIFIKDLCKLIREISEFEPK